MTVIQKQTLSKSLRCKNFSGKIGSDAGFVKLRTVGHAYNPDDEDLSDCLEVIIKDRKENRPHHKLCVRCESRSLVNTRFPYCMDCGWDSLEDSSWGHDE